MDKQAILDALDAFIRTRPGFDPANYDPASYRADARMVARQLREARVLLRAVEWRSITAEDILRAAQGGRLDITETPKGVRIGYTTGQYYCTEYRAAVARLLASVLWGYVRDAMLDADGKSDGDALRARFRREFGRGLASRYFR
jgi:hypothetical protein